MDKKGQLMQLEWHFLWIGAVIGFILFMVLVYLGTKGIIPFKIPLCPVGK